MTLQLEFFKLSEFTGDAKYMKTAEKAVGFLKKIDNPLPGQFPVYITRSGALSKRMVSWGAMGDSGYEYLLKLWILTGKSNSVVREMWEAATVGMLNNLYTEVGNNAYIAE